MNSLEIEFKLKLGVKFDDAACVYVGWCPVLDVYSQGETAEQARHAVEEASALYLKHCYLRGILGSELRGKGFEPVEAVIGGDTEDAETIFVREYKEQYEHTVPLHLLTKGLGAFAGAGACPS